MSSRTLTVEDVSVRVGTFELRHISFSVEAGQVFVVVGPSGAGKSVLLETIAGFNTPQSGRILVGEHDITAVPLEKRQVGFMFQDYALFPHLTVEKNVAFGLRRNIAQRSKARRTAELLARLDLEKIADRRTTSLSGGEKQRVALARALATDPKLFLFDEPLSALDANTRDLLREELRSLLRSVGRPTVYVTHDQTEALVLADQMAVIRDGEPLQVGTPAEVFNSPANEFVARFVGVENIVEGQVVGTDHGNFQVRLGDGQRLYVSSCSMVRGSRILACFRPEDVSLVPAGRQLRNAVNALTARIVSVETFGPVLKIRLDCGFRMSAYLTRQTFLDIGIAAGQTVSAVIRPEAIHLISPGA